MKINLLFTTLLMLTLCLTLQGQTFKEVDFQRLLLDHPMMKNYDEETGHLNHTPYALKSVDKLRTEVENLEKEIKALESKQQELNSAFAGKEDVNEEALWDNVNTISNKLLKLKFEVDKKLNQISQNGNPGYVALFPIVNQMLSDILSPLKKEKTIVLNKLPKYLLERPKIDKNFKSDFLSKTKDVNSIKEYIKSARIFASRLNFQSSDKIILYDNNKEKNFNVAAIDPVALLMLHPKMALFDGSRLGFLKLELSLSRNEYKEKLESLKNGRIDKTDEIQALKKELINLSIKKREYSNTHMEPWGSQEYQSFFEELYKKKKELHKEIFDLEYIDKNPDITSPEDSIKQIEEIHKDLAWAINEVAKKQNLSLVLNSSLPATFDYKPKYTYNNIFGLGTAGINYAIFYSFLALNHLKEIYESREQRWSFYRWKSLNNYHSSQRVFYLKPYPIVLGGCKNILTDAVKMLYHKYGVHYSSAVVLDSVLSKVDSYEN